MKILVLGLLFSYKYLENLQKHTHVNKRFGNKPSHVWRFLFCFYLFSPIHYHFTRMYLDACHQQNECVTIKSSSPQPEHLRCALRRYLRTLALIMCKTALIRLI